MSQLRNATNMKEMYKTCLVENFQKYFQKNFVRNMSKLDLNANTKQQFCSLTSLSKGQCSRPLGYQEYTPHTRYSEMAFPRVIPMTPSALYVL